MFEQYAEYILDDTSGQRRPKVGDKLRGPYDIVEVLAVSGEMEKDGKRDVAVHFKVIESFSVKDSQVGDTETLLFGDMLAMGDVFQDD